MRKKYKTRFPMARIKKIMQKDDEVGKIASATPILISKCLEMFLSDLLNKTCEITKSKNARLISVTHLKQCIKGEPNFDFLQDIVEKVPDIEPEKPEKRGRPRKGLSASGNLRASKGGGDSDEEEEDEEEEEEEEDEEEEEEEEEEDTKKKKRGRKPKAEPKPKPERKKREPKPKPVIANTGSFPLTASSGSLSQFPSTSPNTTTTASAFPGAPPSFGNSPSPFANNPMFAPPPAYPNNPSAMSSVLPPRPKSPPLSSSFTFSAPPKRVQDDYEDEEMEEASGNVQTAPIAKKNVPMMTNSGLIHNPLGPSQFPNPNFSFPQFPQLSPLTPPPPSLARKSNMADILRSSKDVEDYDFSAEFVVQQPKDTM